MGHDNLSHQEMADGLRRMADSKRTWITNFSTGSKPRPAAEIEQQRRNLAVLHQAANHFQGKANARDPVEG